MTDLLELNAVPVIYADGIGRVVVTGGMVRVFLFELRPVQGIISKVCVAEVIRPFDTFMPDIVRRLQQTTGDAADIHH